MLFTKPSDDFIKNYEMLVNNITDYAIYMLDTDGIVLTWNLGAKNIKQYEAQEIIGQHFSLFYIKEDRQKLKPLKALKQATVNRKYEEEYWRLKKDGTKFWASICIYAIYNSDKLDKKLIGFGEVAKDLTKDRELFLNLKLNSIFINHVDEYAIFLLAVNGNILSWNEGAKRIKQYDTDEIVGKHFSIFYMQEDIISKRPERDLNRAKETGRCIDVHWRIKKDGTKFLARVVIEALYDNSKNLIGFGKLTKDLSENYINNVRSRSN